MQLCYHTYNIYLYPNPYVQTVSVFNFQLFYDILILCFHAFSIFMFLSLCWNKPSKFFFFFYPSGTVWKWWIFWDLVMLPFLVTHRLSKFYTLSSPRIPPKAHRHSRASLTLAGTEFLVSLFLKFKKIAMVSGCSLGINFIWQKEDYQKCGLKSWLLQQHGWT